MKKKIARKSNHNFLWTTATEKWPSIWIAKWIDPSSETNKTWLSPEDVKKTNPLPCLAAGFLVERNKDCVKIVSTVCANGYSGQIIAIPIKSLIYFAKLSDVSNK